MDCSANRGCRSYASQEFDLDSFWGMDALPSLGSHARREASRDAEEDAGCLTAYSARDNEAAWEGQTAAMYP